MEATKNMLSCGLKFRRIYFDPHPFFGPELLGGHPSEVTASDRLEGTSDSGSQRQARADDRRRLAEGVFGLRPGRPNRNPPMLLKKNVRSVREMQGKRHMGFDPPT